MDDRKHDIVPVGILGGGLAGVALQHFLKLRSEILEKEGRPGGLCRSWEVDGVTADRGPHVIFSRDRGVLSEMVDILGDNVHRLYRRNFIRFDGRFIPYPFENGLYALGMKTRLRFLRDYVFNPARVGVANNLEEWAHRTFGSALARAYFLPYNRKLWKRRPRELALDWVGRVPRPDITKMFRAALGIRTEGYLQQRYFYHPRRGGIEALVKALISDPARIRTHSEVKRLEKGDGFWKVETGSGEYRYRHVVCCLPLQELIGALEPRVPAAARSAGQKLEVNIVILVLMIYPSSRTPSRFAVYIPDREILPHRISWVNYLGSELVAKGRHAVLAEISSRSGDECSRMDDQTIARNTVRQLRKVELLPAGVPVETRVRREPYGYVVDTLGTAAARKTILDFCRGLDIPLLGRWAEFEYLNMDAVWARARSLAADLEIKWGRWS